MPADFYPRREADIVAFTGNFSATISADPDALGLTPAQAAEYAAAQQAFADLHRKSLQGSTNTSSVVQAKKHARRTLERLTRQLAAIIRSRPATSLEQRRSLGLPTRDPGRPPGSRNVDRTRQITRIGPPRLIVRVLRGRTLRVVLRDRSAPMNRSTPDGADGAVLLSAVGEHPPPVEDRSQWKFERITSKTVTTVQPGGAEAILPPGTKVWVTAFWCVPGSSPRGRHGPACAPVYAYTQEGVDNSRRMQRRPAA